MIEWEQPGRHAGESLGGIRVRIPRPGEFNEFEKLVGLVETSIEDLRSEIVDGTAGDLLKQARGPDGRPVLQRQLARVIAGDLDPLIFLNSVSLPLVATNSDNKVIGALQAIAPGQLMAGLIERQWPRDVVLACATRAAKVSAVWVEGLGRRSGTGTALLLNCCEIYFDAGYRLVYGNYRGAGRAELEAFYRAAGFKILEPGDHVLLGLGADYRVVEIVADADQGMFYMTRADWRRGRN
jgi:ribosomal protein S18 acetylase RimI-like enzyme